MRAEYASHLRRQPIIVFCQHCAEEGVEGMHAPFKVRPEESICRHCGRTYRILFKETLSTRVGLTEWWFVFAVQLLFIIGVVFLAGWLVMQFYGFLSGWICVASMLMFGVASFVGKDS